MTEKTPSFEESLEKLEAVVKTLEEGQLSLEEAVQEFENGIELSAVCAQMLEQSSERVKTLVEKAGKIIEETIDPDRNSADGKERQQ